MDPPEPNLNQLIQSRLEICHEALQRGIPLEKTKAYLELLETSRKMLDHQLLILRDHLDIGIAHALELELDAEGPKSKDHSSALAQLEYLRQRNSDLASEIEQLQSTQTALLIEILQYQDYLDQNQERDLLEDEQLARQLQSQLNVRSLVPKPISFIPPLPESNPPLEDLTDLKAPSEDVLLRLARIFKIYPDMKRLEKLRALGSSEAAYRALFAEWEKAKLRCRLEVAIVMNERSLEADYHAWRPNFNYIFWLDKEIAFISSAHSEGAQKEHDLLTAVLWCTIDDFETGEKLDSQSVNSKNRVFLAAHRRWLKYLLHHRSRNERVSPCESRARLRQWGGWQPVRCTKMESTWESLDIINLIDVGHSYSSDFRIPWLVHLHQRCYEAKVEFLPIFDAWFNGSPSAESKSWVRDPHEYSPSLIAFLWSTVSNSAEAGILTTFFGTNKDSMWYMNAWVALVKNN